MGLPVGDREEADYRPGIAVDRTLALACVQDAILFFASFAAISQCTTGWPIPPLLSWLKSLPRLPWRSMNKLKFSIQPSKQEIN